jgi:hypothetical protein
MIYIAVIALAVSVVSQIVRKRFALTRHAVNAARVGDIDGPVVDEFLSPGFVRDEDGNWIDLMDKFIGWASGASMARFGIPQGATFVATYLKDADRAALIKGDLVVIDAPTKRSPSGLRLRCIDKFSDGNAEFDATTTGSHIRFARFRRFLPKSHT